jgi:hypothetical protein
VEGPLEYTLHREQGRIGGRGEPEGTEISEVSEAEEPEWRAQNRGGCAAYNIS